MAGARDPLRFSPIFVLATPRSCSSVITTMIGQHPALAGLPELKLFCCGTIGQLALSLPEYWTRRGIAHRSPGLVRAVAEFGFGGQHAAALGEALGWLAARPDWSGADVLDWLMEHFAPRVAVEKSPENVEDNSALARLAAAYPAARYIHLTRHPLATQRSMQRHWQRVLDGIAPQGEPMAGIAIWFEMHRRILAFCDTLPAGRTLRVRAEDILNATDTSLRTIADWLGISTGDSAVAAMKHPEASPFARPGPAGSGIIGGNDPDFLADPRPRPVGLPRSLAAPDGWTADPSIWPMVVDLAQQLGYGDEVGSVQAIARP